MDASIKQKDNKILIITSSQTEDQKNLMKTEVGQKPELYKVWLKEENPIIEHIIL